MSSSLTSPGSRPGTPHLDPTLRTQEISVALQVLSQLPEVREGLVAEIQQELREGTFQVDPEQIADRLLEGAP